MYEHILVPVDLTSKNARALDAALDLAIRHGSGVTLLHVIEVVPHVPFQELATFYADLEGSARKKMKKLAEPFERKKVRVSSKIVYGNRAVEIAKYALKGKVSLIIMTSHKIHPGFPGEGWGTISYKVGMLAPASVLLVK